MEQRRKDERERGEKEMKEGIKKGKKEGRKEGRMKERKRSKPNVPGTKQMSTEQGQAQY